MVYFDDIGTKQICPDFKAIRTHSVAKQKPAPIVIYDYYDSSKCIIIRFSQLIPNCHFQQGALEFSTIHRQFHFAIFAMALKNAQQTANKKKSMSFKLLPQNFINFILKK